MLRIPSDLPLKTTPASKLPSTPKNDRLQHLQHFQPWTGAPTDLPIYMKIKGKYTTDHVPAEGPG
ncbi:hypothetical protein EST38_g12435 [Candolleomyces aberdarensis]|uniref:Uncharacterized protein n=1 Tax=Candolleomyces aberdarensis TaxID=2316362 RepID=A0A4Q2D370_9AGAR|nr:hypothetical protein EST38_g12435 [Candolleomyces aberdarensis]